MRFRLLRDASASKSTRSVLATRRQIGCATSIGAVSAYRDGKSLSSREGGIVRGYRTKTSNKASEIGTNVLALIFFLSGIGVIAFLGFGHFGYLPAADRSGQYVVPGIAAMSGRAAY